MRPSSPRRPLIEVPSSGEESKMKQRAFVVLGAPVMAFALLLGCTPSPEATCDRVMKLAEEEASKKDKEIKDSKKTKLKDKCVTEMKEMQEKDADAYKCTAKCIKAVKQLDDAFMCMGLCNYKPKKDKDKSDD